MTTELPWLLIAFASGTLFGGAAVIALLVMLIEEAPLTMKSNKNKEWEYE